MLAFILINSFKYINCVGASHMGLLDKILIACGLQKKASKHVKKVKKVEAYKSFSAYDP